MEKLSDAASPELGLTEEEALRRLERDGPNEPVTKKARSLPVELLRRFTNPLVAILILASIASAALRDFSNAAVILSIVALSIAIELVQTHRADRSARGLAAQVAPTATVLRDGRWSEQPRRGLVVGDVVRLVAGDMVPADGRLLEARDLHVSEAALTGESLPVEKAAGASVFMGSSVVSGTATATVSATGARTEFGDIARELGRRAGPTEFERGIARFGSFIGKTVMFLVLFVFAAAAALRRDALESLLFAVALAVGLTPEFLPMISTVTLTRGAVRMARAKVIVKNLAAIQNFGSIDVLCSDKTGTLTTGDMTLEVHVDPFGKESERPLLLAYVNSYFESGIENPLDQAVLEKGKLDPLDSAVLRHDHPDIQGFRKVDEVPFDFERRRVSVVAARDGEFLLVTKGAAEHVLDVCSEYEADDRVSPLDEDARGRCRRTVEDLSRRGLRVLGVASRALERRAAYGKEDERDLVLAGFVAFVDSPREDAKEVLSELRREGIHVKVLTGDSELVAKHVCDRVGIPTKRLLTGREIDQMSDPALAHVAQRVHVFARVTPAHKSRILRALRSRGHVVGFLGDGINDAPSLHAADVGISVSNATDVAKDAASIILLEPGLRVLLDGVLEGRRAFGNVMKYLLMGTSSNFGNMFSMAGASVFLPFLPMLPKQILLNSFLYDLAQITIPYDNVDARFMRKPRRWDIDLIRRFMIWIGPISSLYDFLTFAILLHVFHAAPPEFRTGWFVESLATQTLVIFVIRTGLSPLKSRPSRALTATTLAIVAIGILLPFTPVASWLGFVPLEPAYFLFLAPATLTYLLLVEIAKRRLLRRAL